MSRDICGGWGLSGGFFVVVWGFCGSGWGELVCGWVD